MKKQSRPSLLFSCFFNLFIYIKIPLNFDLFRINDENVWAVITLSNTNRRKWVQEMWWTQQVRAACKSDVSKWLVYQHWHSFPIIRKVFWVLVLLILQYLLLWIECQNSFSIIKRNITCTVLVCVRTEYERNYVVL